MEYFSIIAVDRKRGDGHHSPVEIDAGIDSRVLLACTRSKLRSCRVSHRGKPLQVNRAGKREVLLVVIELPHAIDDEANIGCALMIPTEVRFIIQLRRSAWDNPAGGESLRSVTTLPSGNQTAFAV